MACSARGSHPLRVCSAALTSQPCRGSSQPAARASVAMLLGADGLLPTATAGTASAGTEMLAKSCHRAAPRALCGGARVAPFVGPDRDPRGASPSSWTLCTSALQRARSAAGLATRLWISDSKGPIACAWVRDGPPLSGVHPCACTIFGLACRCLEQLPDRNGVRTCCVHCWAQFRSCQTLFVAPHDARLADARRRPLSGSDPPGLRIEAVCHVGAPSRFPTARTVDRAHGAGRGRSSRPARSG